MKFSIVSALLLFASSTLADTKYFSYPFKDSVFSPGETVTFVASDINNEKDVQITITLNDERGNFLQDLGQFRGDQADEDAFVFTWIASAPPGNYYVEILQHETDEDDDKDGDDDEEEDEDEDDDDKLRSYTFSIGSGRPQYGGSPYGQYDQVPPAPQRPPPSRGRGRYRQNSAPVPAPISAAAPVPAPVPASNQPGVYYGGQGLDYAVSSYLPLMNDVSLQSEESSVKEASQDEKKVEKQEQRAEAKKLRKRSRI